MPGLKIEIDTNAAQMAASQLRKELTILGSAAVSNEKELKKLEDRLEKGMKADKAQKTLDALNNSIKLSRIEMARHQTRIGDYGGAFKTLSSGADIAAKRIAVLGASLSAAAVGGAVALGSQFLDTAVKFEKFNIQLKTITGSSEKAEAAMKWITSFTAKTPYELDEVTDSFIKLNAYGLDSSEWMKTLGDTAAAMGKGLDQTVEMFADAAVGEFERLKEFGVKASTEGDTVTFKWSQNGEDMVTTAQKTQSGITSALGEIFKRFDGSMDDLSQSWGGMTSNISDIWTQFQNQVMTSGPFSEMEKSLKSFLDYLNSNQGQMDLAGWAEDISVAVLDVVNKFQDWVEKNKEFIRQDLPGEIKEIAGQIITAGGNISSFLTTALSGWNSLPGIIQEVGFMGAVAFGPKGLALLTSGSYLISEFRDFFEGIDGLQSGRISMSEFVGDESEFEAALERYRKYKSGIAAIDNASGSVTKAINKDTPGYDSYLKNSGSIQPDKTGGGGFTGPSKSDSGETAAKQAAAWQSAYSSLDTITQATYDRMLTYYSRDYEANLNLLGDKETAQAIYASNVDTLNDKMFGAGIDAALSSAFGDFDEYAEKYNKWVEEGKEITKSMRTPTEQLADRLANLKEMFDATAISAETYGRAVLDAQNDIAGASVDEALGSFFSDIDEQTASLAKGDYWDQWLAAAEKNVQDVDAMVGDMISNATSSFGSFFANTILQSDSVGDALYNMANGMASSMLSAIGQMAAQWLVYQAVKAASDKTTQASAAVTMTANAQAASLQAGLNAYSSAAAIPLTGWIQAPAAMAAAIGATEPIAAQIAALSVMGIAHDGIDSIPQTGTWLLEKGERVTTESTSERLDRTLANVQALLSHSGGENNTKAGAKNLQPGTTPNITVQSNQKIINVWDESMISDHISSGRADAVIINRIKKNASTIKGFLS